MRCEESTGDKLRVEEKIRSRERFSHFGIVLVGSKKAGLIAEHSVLPFVDFVQRRTHFLVDERFQIGLKQRRTFLKRKMRVEFAHVADVFRWRVFVEFLQGLLDRIFARALQSRHFFAVLEEDERRHRFDRIFRRFALKFHRTNRKSPRLEEKND